MIASGRAIAAPIVLILGDGTPHLVTGNDRLMIARAMNAKVMAFYVDMAVSSKHSDIAEMPVTGYRR
jgi:hypothetical protein